MDVENEYCQLLSNESIKVQLQKILCYPDFAVSGVMTRFLSYIVHETISDRSHTIKEYSIGVEVLNKPQFYKPSSSGVVRVHARRLRDTLDKYYKTQGLLDELIISLPKGRYVPLFECQKQNKPKIDLNKKFNTAEKIKLAVLPFTFHGKYDQGPTLSENIVLLLNTEFGLRKDFTVLSNYTSRQLISKKISLKRLALGYGLHFIVSGSLHFEDSGLRVYVQLTDVKNENLIWSNAYTLRIGTGSFFGLEDRIAHQIMTDLNSVNDIFEKKFNIDIESKTGDKITDKKIHFLSQYATIQN
jgi:TolB-like protein